MDAKSSRPEIRRERGFVRIRCPYCGAEYRVPSTVTYATCPYCGTTFRIDYPEAKIEHYLFKIVYDKNLAYRLARDFASQQVGVVEDLVENSSFVSAELYYVPVYIYEVNVKALCRGEREKIVGDGEVEIDVHGGEEFSYELVRAVDKLPIPLPKDYGFPARARVYFKPTVLKEGRYIQPSLDPMRVFERVKESGIKKAVEEARIACTGGYEVDDRSRYYGLAHYPFWWIRYRYGGKVYHALVDAADGTIVYLEYPLSMSGLLMGLGGGIASALAAGGIGSFITWYLLKQPLYGFIGGFIAGLPGFLVTASRMIFGKGRYMFKPGEEALFMPTR